LLQLRCEHLLHSEMLKLMKARSCHIRIQTNYNDRGANRAEQVRPGDGLVHLWVGRGSNADDPVNAVNAEIWIHGG
jgi:hypothetical protein